MIEWIGLTPHRNKAISLFSSGMKQRVKLALNFYADVEVLLFDEPTMNLDEDGIAWYQSELAKIKKERIRVPNYQKVDVLARSYVRYRLNIL